MGNEQHGDSAFAVEFLQQLQDLRLDGHVKGSGRFVQQQQARFGGNGGRNHAALQHATGKLVRILAPQFFRLRQFHGPHGLQRFLFPGVTVEARVDQQHFGDLFADLHQRVHGAHGFLEYHADLSTVELAQFRARGVQQIAPIQQNLTGIAALLSRQEPGDAHGGNGLAAAAFTDQPYDLAVTDVKRDAGYGFAVAVIEFYMQITNLQHGPEAPHQAVRRRKPAEQL